MLRALLLQILYSIRSERHLVEQLEYNLLEGAVVAQFLARVLGVAESAQLISPEHFSVDGTLLEAWASQKSERPLDDTDRDRPIYPDSTGLSFHGVRRTNATHRSVTDPDARMARKSNDTASILGDQRAS